LTVTFENKLASEEIESLKSLGAGVIPNKDETQIKYTFGADSVNMELLSKLYKHSKKVRKTNACPAGSVNLATLQSMFKVCGIITWFLKTHVYPAFSGPCETDAIESAFDTIEGFISLKRLAATQTGPDAKRARREDEEEEREEMDLSEDMVETIGEMMFGDEVSRVPKAKPSTIPENIMGSHSDAPALPGLAFPYFDGMIADDTNFVSAVIRQYFLECLGDSREAILSGYKDLKLHMGILASTKPGRILQHICTGIKLAIEGQARLYLVEEGERYVGFTIHGWYFSVSIDGYKHTPIEHGALLTELAAIDGHNVALAKILLQLSKLKLTISHKVPSKKQVQEFKAECTTPRGLAAIIRRFERTDAENDEIEKLATNLTFPQRFWAIDNKAIIKAVELLLAESLPDTSEPMYMRGGVLTSESVELSIFALFGDQAFSFRMTGGQPKKVPKDIASDVLFKPYRGKNGKEVIPKPNFVIAKKSLSLCIEDWKAFMIDHVVYTKQNRDAIFRSIVLGGERSKDFWYGLIKLVGPIRLDEVKGISADVIDLAGDTVFDNADDFADFL